MKYDLWDPIREMENMLQRYSRAKGGGLATIAADSDMDLSEWSPTVDIEEDDKGYTVLADLPGVKKKDISVSLENGVLSITGEKHVEKETGKKGGKKHRMERFHGTFSRRFTLPGEVMEDKVEARYEDGVLSLTIPKAEEAKPRSVDIKIS